MIGQINDLVGVSGQGRSVAGNQMFPLAHAHHQRAAQPRGDHHVRMIAKQNDQPIRPLQLRQGPPHRLDQRPMPLGDRAAWAVEFRRGLRAVARNLLVETTGNQMRNDFAVRRRAKQVALALEARFDGPEVFDDAVVDDCDDSVAAKVRMGVGVGGGTVRGPARVPDANCSAGRNNLQTLRQVVEPARALGDGQRAFVDRGDAGAVVAAIFEPAQTFHQVGDRLARTDVTDNSTHEMGRSSLRHDPTRSKPCDSRSPRSW